MDGVRVPRNGALDKIAISKHTPRIVHAARQNLGTPVPPVAAVRHRRDLSLPTLHPALVRSAMMTARPNAGGGTVRYTEATDSNLL